ncbi:MAG: hypothetical protein QOF76_2704 [Solirubrobacteraceae bacterium]|jgi:hypothetical protein|nr:hypothetical protein [Solirubrobacteraceae bacterium]
MASRILPRPGGSALVVTLGQTVPATIVAVVERTVTVETEDGETIEFQLHPKTAQFVRTGDPSWGVRLRLLAPDAG